MTRLWLFLVFLLSISLTAVWMADNPGGAIIEWWGWRVETSPAFLLVAILVLLWMFTIIYSFVHHLVYAPRRFLTQRQLTHQRQGLSELTYSVAALAISDAADAERHARKARRLLGVTPMGLLVLAQVSRLRGEGAQTRALLETMLTHRETEHLAARLLSDDAGKQHALPRALELAERAYSVNPRDAAALSAIVSLHLKLGGHAEALAAVDRAAARGRVTARNAARWRGLSHLLYGASLLEKDSQSALVQALIAQKLLKGFAPATLLAARAYDANRQPEKAIALLLRTWKTAPHPQIAALAHMLAAKLPKRKLSHRLRALSAAGEYTAGVWVCRACGHNASEWSAHCPSCEAFDTMEWR